MIDMIVKNDTNCGEDSCEETALVGARQFDEDAALQAALEIFWRQGFSATTMSDLADATGVQRGSLYNAYGDKDTIFLRAYDLYAKRVLEDARASLQGDDAVAMLDSFFEMIIANMTGGAPARGCLTTKTAADDGIANPQIRQRLRTQLDGFLALLDTALSRPVIRRQLILEPTEAKLVIVTFTRGMAVMERIYGNRKALLRAAQALSRTLVKPLKNASPKDA